MKLIYFTFLIVPAALLCLGSGNILARAEEDELDDVVDIEGEDNQVVGDDALVDDDESVVKSSQDIDTTILFTKPVPSLGDLTFDIQAGYPVEFFVGFINKGSVDYVVESMEASFRYPMDYTYYIQNFTALPYNREVKPKQEATFAYSFIPNEAFAGRPFGLNVQLNYRDASGNAYQEAVYNQTLNIVEVSEGLDGETFFLYVFLGAGGVLALVAGQQALASLARRRSPRSVSQPVETGTASEVDYDWLPKEIVNQLKKSPKTPKQSPRARKAKRSAGDD
ncbi:translocon-associated protein subunit alpha [Bombyx mandarina]|uniref:Translocon-associated protein subunit alpha n=2 Tax=Bombyx TaxID=7090 RepID=Q2F5L0_BOMMO|nr:signal sequence receptor precursor [Bombyx mori]XP_028029140.1 translocon-associated protein subunit alpha [Bombyx mandarina]ABD36357.1 signal sequence receptor [Bombyx mori]